MEIKIKKINDPDTNVPVNKGEHEIRHIKAEFARCKADPPICQVEVFDMWSELSE